DGEPMREQDWTDPDLRLLAVEMRMASGTPGYAALPGAIYLVFNAGKETPVRLPDIAHGKAWRRRLDSSRDDGPDQPAAEAETVAADSVTAFVMCGAGEPG